MSESKMDDSPPSNPFARLIKTQGVVILDGALATELEGRGADLRDPLWSAKLLLENPALIRTVHADYFAAGADVATTASYQATFAGFARRGLPHAQAAELMRLSVQLAIEARDQFSAEYGARNAEFGRNATPKFVAASIGPYGAFLADGSEYRGDYGLTVAQLMDFHRPRLAVLAAAGADLLACETIPCLTEGVALVRLLREFPQVQAWLSFSCRDEHAVCHGEAFAECVALANRSAQIVAIGVNCTPPEYVEALLLSAAGVTVTPLLAYPNSGDVWDAALKCWLPAPRPTQVAEWAQRWYAAGARFIGGCCRTTPADIHALTTVLKR